MRRSITLAELAQVTGTVLFGEPSHLISGVETLETATPQQAAFLENPRYAKQIERSQAGVFFVHPHIERKPEKNYLVTPHTSFAFQKALELFIDRPLTGFPGIHPTAVIHPETSLDPSVIIGPYAVIDRGVRIGAHTTIGAHSYVGPESTLGIECLCHPHVVIRERCTIGDRVIIQPGAVVGACGFGYFTDSQGKHHHLTQLGSVEIQDDVEVGANTTIDRARFGSTEIKPGTKIDNLVQIGHQVQIGADNIIVAQTGIAGSTTTGNHVVLGGQVGVAGHLHIGDGVMVAAQSGVTKSLREKGAYAGAPAIPIKRFYLHMMHIRNLGKLYEHSKTQLPLQEKESSSL